LPFGGRLNPDNRWIKLAQLIPWAQVDRKYAKSFKKSFRGQKAVSVRMALGALIIQERLQLSDRETVETIVEKPYLQYFLGLTGYQDRPPFHHSLMTHFRKRLGEKVIAEVNEYIAVEAVKEEQQRNDDDDKAKVEFGAKVSVSMVQGFAFLERRQWDNFNEGVTLIESVEAYKERFGVYPKEVLADQIYRNRENRAYCKERGIRLSGPPLGRPSKQADTTEMKQIAKLDAGERNAIEGKFGEGKRKYGLNRIRARLEQTSGAVIALEFLVMNLERRLRLLFVLILNMLLKRTAYRQIAL